MKKLMLCMMMVPMLSALTPVQLKASTEPVPTSLVVSKTVGSAKDEVLLARLQEIKTMDKSKLSASEKKQLRREARSIKDHFKALGSGVYLSVGAIIIIVLLLILLL